MGCGCIGRGDRWAAKVEERGHNTAAKILRAAPRITDRIQKRAERAVRSVLRVETEQEPHAAERWSMHDLPMSGRTSIGGHQSRQE